MVNSHIVNHIHRPQLKHCNTLHVIGVCSNPVRWHSRYRIAREWIEHMTNHNNVHLTVVESAFGDRHHELRHCCNDNQVEFIALRTKTEAWIKESMINVGARHAIVKHDAQYLAWIDMDVFFHNENWAQETLHQLQHFEIVQPWSDAIDMGAHGNTLQHFKSFGLQHQRGVPKQKHPSQKEYQYAHTGFAWACTRRFWEATNGLMTFAILGSADHHMAFGCINEVMDTVHAKMHSSFKRRALDWQRDAFRACHGDVGFVPGTIIHKFHGPKKRRYYRERWQILFNYDPDTMLMRDHQGLVYIINNHQLERDIRHYNRSRFEDSIEEF